MMNSETEPEIEFYLFLITIQNEWIRLHYCREEKKKGKKKELINH